MIRINLLPVKAAQKKEQLRNQLLVFIVTLVFVAAGCYYTRYMVQNEIDTVKQEIENNNAEIKKLQKKIGEVKKFKELQAELKNKLEVLKSLKEAKSGPVHLMDDLINALPENLWITDYQDKKGNIVIKGVGLSEDDVAELMTNLERSNSYRNISLKLTKQKEQEGLKLKLFELLCQIESKPISGAESK